MSPEELRSLAPGDAVRNRTGDYSNGLDYIVTAGPDGAGFAIAVHTRRAELQAASEWELVSRAPRSAPVAAPRETEPAPGVARIVHEASGSVLYEGMATLVNLGPVLEAAAALDAAPRPQTDEWWICAQAELVTAYGHAVLVPAAKRVVARYKLLGPPFFADGGRPQPVWETSTMHVPVHWLAPIRKVDMGGPGA